MESIRDRAAGRLTLRGKKRTCLKDGCGERFYDLNKNPKACPYCGTSFVPAQELIFKPKESRKSPYHKLEKPQPTPITAKVLDDESSRLVDADDVEEEIIEDTGGAASLLDAEDDDSSDEAEEVNKKPSTPYDG